MTGSGNDFVMVDARVTVPDDWTTEDIHAVCARGTGIGADGLVFVGPGKAPGAIRMVYFNSDGSHAAMCGNAALCSTRLAVHLGLGKPSGFPLETDAGKYEGKCGNEADRAELRLPSLEAPVDPHAQLCPGEERAALATVGVPHLVVLVRDVGAVDLAARGKALRSDPALGPEGANVNFISPAPRKAAWLMRTYERGIEAETLACGTGAVAAACALETWGLDRLPTTIITRTGLPLEIQARRSPEGPYEDVWLRGQARMVFRAVLTG
jgi:diaminopimelate epimerase